MRDNPGDKWLRWWFGGGIVVVVALATLALGGVLDGRGSVAHSAPAFASKPDSAAARSISMPAVDH